MLLAWVWGVVNLLERHENIIFVRVLLSNIEYSTTEPSYIAKNSCKIIGNIINDVFKGILGVLGCVGWCGGVWGI